MKIDAIDTFCLRAPVETPFTSARGWWYKTKNAMLVRIRTSDGVEGWGEAYGPADVTSKVIETLLTPMLVGQDPAQIDVLWHAMYQRVEDYDPQGFAVAAMSAIDIALWDAFGKVTGQPVHRLLGGAHRTWLQPYATGLYFTKEDGDHVSPAAEEAQRYRDQGFRGVKMKIALPVREEIRRVETVREALGEGVELMVDANHGYDRPDALRLGRAFERMGITWFEEPISPNDLDGYRELRTRIDTPLAGGENAFTRFAFAPIIAGHAMDIIQPDVCCAGGITEFQRISAMAGAAGVAVVPHVWGSAVGLYAALQVMAALPPAPQTWKPSPLWMEYEQTENPFRDKLARTPVTIQDGAVEIPTGPGLGLEIAEDIIRHYDVRR
jgi:D-galactarolactone cycloisomerase